MTKAEKWVPYLFLLPALLVIAFFRELLGSGAIWGVPVLGPGWTPWAIMVMAPGGFFMLAIFIWIMRGKVLKPAPPGVPS